jgi:hypothetical protein
MVRTLRFIADSRPGIAASRAIFAGQRWGLKYDFHLVTYVLLLETRIPAMIAR